MNIDAKKSQGGLQSPTQDLVALGPFLAHVLLTPPLCESSLGQAAQGLWADRATGSLSSNPAIPGTGQSPSKVQVAVFPGMSQPGSAR